MAHYTITKPNRRKIKARTHYPPKERTSTLTAEEYHAKYLVGGNASFARFLRYNRMRRREAK